MRRVRAAGHVQEVRWQPNRSSKPYSVLRNNRPSSAGWDILSVDEDDLARLGDYLHLMSGDMSDHSIMIVLPSVPRARAAVASAKPRCPNDKIRSTIITE